jgi:hypothetical protein
VDGQHAHMQLAMQACSADTYTPCPIHHSQHTRVDDLCGGCSRLSSREGMVCFAAKYMPSTASAKANRIPFEPPSQRKQTPSSKHMNKLVLGKQE